MNIGSLARRPVDYPRTVVVIVAVVGAVALLSALRLQPDTSLSAMMSHRAESVAALERIAHEFRTMDELLLVAEVPEGRSLSETERREVLTRFAQRLEAHIESAPELSGMVRRVRSGLAERADEPDFVRDHILPGLFLYLSDEAFTAAMSRLTAESMREQMRRNEDLIALPGPAAGAGARQILRDPLRFQELLPPSPFAESGRAPQHFSADGSALLIRISGTRSATDLAFTGAFIDAVRRAAERVNHDGLIIAMTGGYAIADTSHQAIRGDMIRSIAGSVVLIQLFLFAVYRRLISFLIVMVPVAVAILISLGVLGVVTQTITPLTAVIGAVLAGLGVDYCVHLLSHYEEQRRSGAAPRDAAQWALRHVGPRTAAAAVTTILGFLALSLSSAEAIRDFSVLAAIGLVAALLASWTLLPALLVLTDRRGDLRRASAPRPRGTEHLLRTLLARRRTSILLTAAPLVIVAAALLISGRGSVRFESDLNRMHPQPNPALDLQTRLGGLFGGGSETMLLHLQADAPDALVALSQEAFNRLRGSADPLVADADMLSLSSVLPAPDVAAARLHALAALDPDEVARTFQAAVEESIFDPAAYAGYTDFLRKLVRPEVPRLRDLAAYSELADFLLPLPESAAEAVSVINFAKPVVGRAIRGGVIEEIRTVLRDLPEGTATLTGLTVVGHDAEAVIRRDLQRLLIVAALAVFAFLLLLLRSIVDLLLTLLPTLFGLACLFTAMIAWTAWWNDAGGFNMINLIALPLLCGIGVDDGIFMMLLARAHKHEGPAALMRRMLASSHAIFVTTVTTTLAFGSLMLTSTPAMQSLGWMTAVGVAGCFVGTLGVLVPILLLRCAKGGQRADSPEGG